MSDEAPPRLGLSEALVMAEEDKSELDKVLALLLDPKNIAHNTELTRNEITAFSVLGTIAKRYSLEVLRGFLDENLVLRVSKGRAGRKETVKIVSRQLAMENQMGMVDGEQRPGWRRFLGGKR